MHPDLMRPILYEAAQGSAVDGVSRQVPESDRDVGGGRNNATSVWRVQQHCKPERWYLLIGFTLLMLSALVQGITAVVKPA